MTPQDTKKRLLEAAEKLFAENGFEATSLRNITSEAGANLASIHYHFGSKEALIQEVFAQYIKPVNTERLRLLDELEAKTPIRLEAVLRSFLTPLIRFDEVAERGKTIHKLFGRIYSESEKVQRLVLGQFEEVRTRYASAIQRVCPHLLPIEVAWRFKFMVGSMMMLLVSHTGYGKELEEMESSEHVDVVLEKLTSFLVGGFTAPPVASRKITQ